MRIRRGFVQATDHIEPIPTPDMNNHARVIYYVTCEGTGVVKIGTTNNMNRRFKAMSKSVKGGRLQLLAWELGDHRLERDRILHFGRTSKIFGDWMVLTEPMVEHILWCRDRAWDSGNLLPPVEIGGETDHLVQG